MTHPTQIQIRKDFDQKHSKRGKAIALDDHWLLYPTGALMESSPHGLIREPPKDKVERLKLLIRYREAVLEQAEEDHTMLHAQIQATFDEELGEHWEGPDGQGWQAYKGSQDEALAELDKSKQRVVELRKDLKVAKELLKELTTKKQSPEQIRMQAEFDKSEERRKERLRKRIRQARI